MNVVLDLGANIECNEKNLVEFSKMGSALFKSLFDEKKPKVALLLKRDKHHHIIGKVLFDSSVVLLDWD